MSEYISINEVDTFEFHDAYFKEIKLTNGNMLWKLESVNVTKRNSQNDCSTDMEASDMVFTFVDCQVTKIEHYVPNIYDQSGKLIEEKPNIIAAAEDYNDILFVIPDDRGWISSLCSSTTQNGYRIVTDILSLSDSLIVEIEFSETKAEWDRFIKEAWYVNFHK